MNEDRELTVLDRELIHRDLRYNYCGKYKKCSTYDYYTGEIVRKETCPLYVEYSACRYSHIDELSDAEVLELYRECMGREWEGEKE